MNLAEIEDTLAQVRGCDGAVAEFEALQDIVGALMLRSQAVHEGLDWSEFYNWYIKRLVALHNEIAKAIAGAGVSYHLRARDPRMVAKAKIRAILDSLPETAQVLGVAANQ
ncbi:MAG TPA: hypothetical protein VF303_04950 [Candidatus Nanoarchaeia archaeon]